MKKPVKTSKIEHIFITKTTQVTNAEIGACTLLDGRVIEIDKKYEASETLPNGDTVYFKVNLKKAGKLIQSNKAVTVKKEGKGGWYACDVYGKKLEEKFPIVLKDPKRIYPDPTVAGPTLASVVSALKATIENMAVSIAELKKAKAAA